MYAVKYLANEPWAKFHEKGHLLAKDLCTRLKPSGVFIDLYGGRIPFKAYDLANKPFGANLYHLVHGKEMAWTGLHHRPANKGDKGCFPLCIPLHDPSPLKTFFATRALISGSSLFKRASKEKSTILLLSTLKTTMPPSVSAGCSST